MAGIEVKPGKPYTHLSSKEEGRLRISQATLAIGTATLKTLVQCNVGDKRPVLLCALLPNKTESLQLDLEFDEAEDVMFSVIGPRGVYLTGYYNPRSILQDDSESFGEDIANSETLDNTDDDDEYDDSFINDDEPEPLTPSPVSSSTDDDDDEGDFIKKKRNENVGHKRLRKRYQSIESDDEKSVTEIDDDDDEDDFPISSICKNNKSQDRVVIDLLNDETTGKGDQQNTCVPSSSAEVAPESKLKTKKKKREEEKITNVLAAQHDEKTNIETIAKVTKINDDKYKPNAVNSEVVFSKHKADIDLVDGEMNPSLAEVVPESKSKKKKKKQESSKEQKGAKNEQKHVNLSLFQI